MTTIEELLLTLIIISSGMTLALFGFTTKNEIKFMIGVFLTFSPVAYAFYGAVTISGEKLVAIIFSLSAVFFCCLSLYMLVSIRERKNKVRPPNEADFKREAISH